jgi:hypothetical protein
MLVGSVQWSKSFPSRLVDFCSKSRAQYLSAHQISGFQVLVSAARERLDHRRIEVARFKEPLRSGQRYFKFLDQE